MTQAMAYTMLSKLYLNAKEWIGKEMWRETSDACDKVIGFGKLSLEPDYFSNFKVNNEDSKENIFVVAVDNIYTSSANDFSSNVFTYSEPADFWYRRLLLGWILCDGKSL